MILSDWRRWSVNATRIYEVKQKHKEADECWGLMFVRENEILMFRRYSSADGSDFYFIGKNDVRKIQLLVLNQSIDCQHVSESLIFTNLDLVHYWLTASPTDRIRWKLGQQTLSSQLWEISSGQNCRKRRKMMIKSNSTVMNQKNIIVSDRNWMRMLNQLALNIDWDQGLKSSWSIVDDIEH